MYVWPTTAPIGAPCSPSPAYTRANSDHFQSNDSHSGGLAYSEPYYPSPWMDPKAYGWEEAYEKAAAFVSQLTLEEKVNLTTGVG